METKTKVHRWTTKNEYFDKENGEEISKQNATQNYDIVNKRKQYKIENYHGYITIINECERKRQTKLW